ncbi:radical SAM protein [Solidesulfovibrio carbinolicus]|uniref:Radical SAM core domain-containing protein n=1 Tax=Solidesulfovibrio carbinolicus TaxID=296842 RepID=A0A4P6HTA4_9BACT|nr:radical SAM protein [Solidesulfovibrio carbinolicus]QAZ68668.1 hypothetical protein C3Y92_16090 [Solidesulfovibrio carbinolicus]
MVKYNEETNELDWFSGESSYISSPLPFFVWHITDRCPWRCPYCFARKSGKDFPAKYIEKIVRLSKKMGVLKVDLSGGEPLLNYDLFDIVNGLESQGIKTTLTTTGYSTLDKLKRLSEIKSKFARIIISLDSSNEKQQDALRGDGYWKTIRTLLDVLGGTSSYNLRVNTVVSNRFIESNQWRSLLKMIEGIAPKEWCLLQPLYFRRVCSMKGYQVADDKFDRFVKQVSGCRGKVKIISRPRLVYGPYWVLDQDLFFRQKTVENSYESGFSIFSSPAVGRAVVLNSSHRF